MNFGACCVDSWGRTGLHLVDCSFVKSPRILHLGFLRLDARAGLDNLQIAVAYRERDHIQDVLITELRSLLGSARCAEPLDEFIAEQCLADACVHRAVAERANNRWYARH